MPPQATHVTRVPIPRRPLDGLPHLSLVAADLPDDDVLYCVQLAADWWGIAIRADVSCGVLIPAYVHRFRNHPLWPTLTTVFDTDPLTEPGRTAALYPGPAPVPMELIPAMEDEGLLARWPGARLL